MFDKKLEVEREKIQAIKSGGFNQTGSMAYPYVSVKPPQEQKTPAFVLLLGGGVLVYFFLKKGGKRWG